MTSQPMILNWMQESLSDYIAELGLSKSTPTVMAYTYDVLQFMQYLTSAKVKRLSTLKSSHVISYLSKCKQEGKSDSSINRYYMSIKSYCKFLRRTKQVLTDLTEDVTPPRNIQKAPKVPTAEEIDRILSTPDRDTESGTRDRAILLLLYSSGLRATELCDLRLEHFKEDGIHIACGKRSKARTVPITLEAALAINVYIELYRGKNKGHLFLTIMGKPLRRQLLSKVVSDYARKAGIEDVTTHTLRHACATHLLDEGADLRLIQEVLGHSSIASTQRYTHLSSSKMQEMFKQFHRRGKE